MSEILKENTVVPQPLDDADLTQVDGGLRIQKLPAAGKLPTVTQVPTTGGFPTTTQLPVRKDSPVVRL